MKQKFIDAYMDVAERFAQLSSATRLQVGAIVVKDDRIISIGYNGMPTGWDNCCEDVVREDEVGFQVTKTKAEVLHAETNSHVLDHMPRFIRFFSCSTRVISGTLSECHRAISGWAWR